MSTLVDPPVVYVCLRCKAFFPTFARSKRRYCLPCEKALETEGWKSRKSKT